MGTVLFINGDGPVYITLYNSGPSLLNSVFVVGLEGQDEYKRCGDYFEVEEY